MPIIYECDACGKQKDRGHVYLAHKTLDSLGMSKESSSFYGVAGWGPPPVRSGSFNPSPSLLEDDKVICQACLLTLTDKDTP